MSDRACMAMVQDGAILMVHQKFRGELLWTFPGGRISQGESPHEAAIREVKEETGLETEVLGLLYTGPRKRGTGMYYCFLGRVVGGELCLGEDPELSPDAQELREVRWIRLSEVAQHPEVSLILPALETGG